MASVLNTQVVPNIPMYMVNALGQQMMNPQWVQYFRALNERVGGATGSVVTSVSVYDTSISPLYTATGDPVTSSGNIDLTLNAQPRNTILMGPSAGPDAQPTFRTLKTGDLPVVDIFHGGTGLSTYPLDGQILIGSTLGQDYTVANITAGSGISVVNGPGSITISTSGVVTAVTGTTNQITASPTTGNVVLSIPTKFVAPGSIEATTGIQADTTITVIDSATVPGYPSQGRTMLYSYPQIDTATIDKLWVANASSEIAIGYEMHMSVYNNSGATIPIGSVVYITGQHAHTPTIGLAKADSATTLPAVGITQYAIANNSWGVIQHFGELPGLNTSAYTAGLPIYVSDATAGAYTQTKPTAATSYVQQIGTVTYVNPSQGMLDITLNDPFIVARQVSQGGTGLITTPTNGQLLIGNGTGYTLSTLTGTANQIAVTNGSGSITLSLASNVVIPAPTSGVALQATGGSGNVVAEFNSSTGTNTGEDVQILRTATTANSVGKGACLALGDTGANTWTILQQSGGQTEIWQYNSSWNQIAYWDTSLQFHTSAIIASGAVTPSTDNTYTLGDSTNRWTVVYATTGTINTSDIRQKTDIQDSNLGLNFVNELRPVSYKWINGGAGQSGQRTHHGLIAQEVKLAHDKLYPDSDFAGWVLMNKDDKKSTQGLRYDQFIAPLIKAVQELSAKVNKLEHELSILRDS